MGDIKVTIEIGGSKQVFIQPSGQNVEKVDYKTVKQSLKTLQKSTNDYLTEKITQEKNSNPSENSNFQQEDDDDEEDSEDDETADQNGDFKEPEAKRPRSDDVT
ncbi:unnamed protein product [Owenia fusiformis]|uniref:Uncharacterized protein n=1 Tax=Owenia fusiformis TaxID=6347 RepID=A0A8J1Y5S7_OWEFU|nr:unnamed protein product [Owenia fusiformis]